MNNSNSPGRQPGQHVCGRYIWRQEVWFLMDNGLTGCIISHTVSDRSYTYVVYPLVLTVTSVCLSPSLSLRLSLCLSSVHFPTSLEDALSVCLSVCLSLSLSHTHSCCSSPGWMSVSNHYRCQSVPSTASRETIETSSVPHYCHSARNTRRYDIPTESLK